MMYVVQLSGSSEVAAAVALGLSSSFMIKYLLLFRFAAPRPHFGLPLPPRIPCTYLNTNPCFIYTTHTPLFENFKPIYLFPLHIRSLVPNRPAWNYGGLVRISPCGNLTSLSIHALEQRGFLPHPACVFPSTGSNQCKKSLSIVHHKTHFWPIFSARLDPPSSSSLPLGRCQPFCYSDPGLITVVTSDPGVRHRSSGMSVPSKEFYVAVELHLSKAATSSRKVRAWCRGF